jgi:hypothetical protein
MQVRGSDATNPLPYDRGVSGVGRWGLAVRAGLVLAVVVVALSFGGFLGPTNREAGAQANSTDSEPTPSVATPRLAESDSVGGNEVGAPEVVRVGFLINDIQDIDLERYRYQLDFYIWFQWTDPDFDPVTSIEFMNEAMRVDSSITPATSSPVKLDDGSYYLREHVFAMFKTNFPIEDYPFDTINLRITVEDRARDTSELVFALDDPAVQTSSDLSVPGYQIGVPFATVTDWYYPPFGAVDSNGGSSSRLTVFIPLQRPWLPYTVKLLIPLIVVLMCAALVFLIRPEHLDARFGLGISALLTLVALKWITDGDMPLIDHLSFVDSLYLLSFLFIAAALAETTYTTRQRGRGVDDAVLIRHDRRVFTITGGLFVVMVVVVFLLYFVF